MTNEPTINSLLNVADAVLGPPLSRGQGDDPAILCGDEVVTFAELNARSNRTGNVFHSLGIGASDRVLLMVADRPIFFYAYFGLLKIGAVPCALNLRLANSDLAYIIADSGARAVLADPGFLPVCEKAIGALEDEEPPALVLSNSENSGRLALSAQMAQAPSVLESVRRSMDAPGFWMYSSGTTGKPKGVIHAQRSVLAARKVMGDVMGVARGDRVFCTSKLFFAYSLAHMVFATLQQGATAILYPGWPDVAAINAVITHHRPDIVLSVPTFYRKLSQGAVASQQPFKEVRYYMSAGEQLPKSLFHRWMKLTGRPILEGIGATETCFLSLFNRPDRMSPGTCGVPTPGTEVKLVDEESAIVEHPGHPGVLWVRMLSVATGYQGKASLTRSVFQDGWYCTNDVFTVDGDGFYEYQGRTDDMLKISGQWVSPVEIEAHVLQNPAVNDAAVVGIPNTDGLVRLALFLEAPGVIDQVNFGNKLQESLVTALSIYKCPRRVFYIESMPRTDTGKLRRNALREIAIKAYKV